MGKYKLNATEKRVLYLKYTSEGMSPGKACERLDSINKKLFDLMINLKNKGKTPEELRARFKEEFEKLCQRY